ncbi:MAG: hypothetical protein J6U92_01325 [Clostridia bacterium]|nr:hypothetical protein [Clostridia bacterium]
MKGIGNINQKLKTFEFDEYFNVTANTENVLLSKGQLSKSFMFKTLDKALPENVSYLKGYYVGGRYFTYCSDGVLYECLQDATNYISQFTKTPCALSFNVMGKDKIIFADQTERAIILDGNNVSSINFMPSDFIISYGGRIFTAYKNCVSFTKLYDFGDQNFDFSKEGVLYLPESAGEIVGVFSVDDKIYLFTKKHLFCLSGAGESIDFKLYEVETENFSLEGFVVDSCEDGFLLVTDKRLGKLKDGKITFYNTLLDLSDFTSIRLSYYSNRCVVTIAKGLKRYLFVYDFDTGEQSLLTISNTDYFGENGLFFHDEFINVAVLGKRGAILGTNRFWDSVDLDFNGSNNKSIREIRILSKATATLTVSGDFGSCNYKLKAGYNYIKCNLPSRYYKFKIALNGFELGISEFKIKYVEREK